MAKKAAKRAKGTASRAAKKKPAAPVGKKASKPARRAGAARTHKPAKSPGRKPARSARKESVLPFFQVDAFTGRLFHGNPAGVVLLEKWLPEEVMQAIAAENNLSETAFIVPASGKAAQGGTRLEIRWFTPAVEVDLCGHATLAAAHVLWRHVGVQSASLTFESASGPLHVEREKDLLVLDFPARVGRKAPVAGDLTAALGREPTEVYESTFVMAVFENKREVHELIPDLEAIAALDTFGVIATAPGAGHDFVSRFFAPAMGIDEDAVTDSAHCTLAPYWAARLGKSRLTAHQVSSRGGELVCEVRDDRVRIGGRAVTYLDGRIRI